MSDTKCPFCGSEELKLKTPFVELDGKGNYIPKETWCCTAQAKNQKYAKSRDVDPNEVSKW